MHISPAAPQDQCGHIQALSPHLVEDIRHVLLAAGLLGIAQLRRVPARQQALVPHQGHALVRNLVPLKVHLVVRTTCRRTGGLKTPGSLRLEKLIHTLSHRPMSLDTPGVGTPSHNPSHEEILPENPAQG